MKCNITCDHYEICKTKDDITPYCKLRGLTISHIKNKFPYAYKNCLKYTNKITKSS